MNTCKPFIGYHDPETCVYFKRIPDTRPLPTEEQLREQWEQTEALLMLATSAKSPEDFTQ